MNNLPLCRAPKTYLHLNGDLPGDLQANGILLDRERSQRIFMLRVFYHPLFFLSSFSFLSFPSPFLMPPAQHHSPFAFSPLPCCPHCCVCSLNLFLRASAVSMPDRLCPASVQAPFGLSGSLLPSPWSPSPSHQVPACLWHCWGTAQWVIPLPLPWQWHHMQQAWQEQAFSTA